MGELTNLVVEAEKYACMLLQWQVKLMSIVRLLFAFEVVFCLLIFSLVSPIYASAGERTAFSAIQVAEDAVVSAYWAVLEAEGAGGDVSGLVARLSEAGDFLAAARMLGGNGNIDEAVRLAGLSEGIGGEVKDAALELKVSTLNEEVQRINFTIAGSVFGIAVVVLGSLLVWRFLKNRYQ